MKSKTFIDLFAGIGGFRVALENKGLRCVFSSEIDPKAREIYKKNFGEFPSGNIKNIPPQSIPKHDILCAGFPCQPFSASGLRKGKNDERYLIDYIVEIIKEKEPKYFILENVPNLLNIDDGKLFNKIRNQLSINDRYTVWRQVLNSARYGIPQSRKRLYLIGCKDGMIDQKFWDGYSILEMKHHKNPIPLKTVLQKPNISTINGIYYNKSILKTYNRTQSSDSWYVANKENKPQIYYKLKYTNRIPKASDPNYRKYNPMSIMYYGIGGQGQRIYTPERPAVTQIANVGHRKSCGMYLIRENDFGKTIIRGLTPYEQKLVMGFPKNFNLCEDKLNPRKALGNAVCPPMIEALYDSFME